MFGKPTKEKEIKKLKSILQDKIIRYNSKIDHFDCGANLAAFISPTVGALARDINETLDKLSALDPKAPKYRYPTGVQ